MGLTQGASSCLREGDCVSHTRPRWWHWLTTQDFLAWPPAERALLTALCIWPFGILWTWLELQTLWRPGFAPFMDPDVMRFAWVQQAVVFLGGWLVVIVWAAIARRRASQGLGVMYATGFMYGIGFGFPLYQFGHFNNSLTGMAIVTGVTAGLLLIERRPLLLGFAVLAGSIVLTTIGEQLGLLPYAPLLRGAPYDQGRLSTTWLLWFGVPTSLSAVMTVGLFLLVVQRWRVREAQLAERRADLARAHEHICRYIAPELAARILRGDLPEPGQHERRRLTILFCDIADFAANADELSSEALARILGDYVGGVHESARDFGGMIDKFVGDSVLIVFDADSAAAAALAAARMTNALRERMRVLLAAWQRDGVVAAPLALRIGIHTGVVSCGNFGSSGRMDFTIIGRQVNIAARLRDRCRGGQVLMSHTTWALVRRGVTTSFAGELRVKGVHFPIRTYELLPAPPSVDLPSRDGDPGGPAVHMPWHERLRAWFGNPVEWSAPAKIRLVASGIIVFAGYHLVALGWAWLHPGTAPYLDPWWLGFGVAGAAVLILGALLATAASYLVADSAPRVLILCTVFFFAAMFGGFSYFLGHWTNALPPILGLGSAGAELFLFPPSVPLVGFATSAMVVMATTVAAYLDLIPYGPALTTAPWADGHMAPFWLLANAVPTMATYCSLFAIFTYVVTRWHEREMRLREATTQLSRARLLVRRYVSPQVADHLAMNGYRVEPTYERRVVTVCFSDIQDFAQTADGMEGEELARVLHEYLSEMAEIAQQHGGTVHKFVGDGMIILFGAPEACEPRDQVAAAVKMAMAMQDRIAELGRRWSDEGIDHPFRVRIGINTGVATMGGFGSAGRREYAVVGSALSLAARLQTQCPAGCILLGPATAEALGDSIAHRPCETADGLEAMLVGS